MSSRFSNLVETTKLTGRKACMLVLLLAGSAALHHTVIDAYNKTGVMQFVEMYENLSLHPPWAIIIWITAIRESAKILKNQEAVRLAVLSAKTGL